MIRYFAGIVAVFFATQITEAAPSDCSAVKDPTKRLKCFDRASKAPEDSSGSVKTIDRQAAESALLCLRRVRSAAQMSSSLRDYSQVLLEQVACIDENLRHVSDGALKHSISKSKEAYVDAKNVWSGMIQLSSSRDFVSIYKPIYSRYQINEKFSDFLDAGKFQNVMEVGPKYIIEPIWMSAGASLVEAEREVGQLPN